MSKEVNAAYGFSLWRSMSTLWSDMKNQTSIEVSMDTIYYSENNCLGDEFFEALFPDIFCLVQHQQNYGLLKIGI